MAILKKRATCAHCNRVMEEGTEISFEKISTPNINGQGFRAGYRTNLAPKHKTPNDCSAAIILERLPEAKNEAEVYTRQAETLSFDEESQEFANHMRDKAIKEVESLEAELVKIKERSAQ